MSSKADELHEEIVASSRALYAEHNEEPPGVLPDIVMFILTFLADKLGVCPLTPEKAQAEARRDSFWVRYIKAKAARAASKTYGIPSSRAAEIAEIAVAVPADKEQSEWKLIFDETKLNTVNYGDI